MSPAYPHSPGMKERSGTSEAAAHAMRGSAEIIRNRVFEVLRRQPMTADEVADMLKVSVLTTRPRVSELAKMGKIERIGRGTNASGCGAWIWQVRK